MTTSRPGPPAMADLGRAEPLPRRWSRLMWIRSSTRTGGRAMTRQEMTSVAEGWNVLARKPSAHVWHPDEPCPFKVCDLRTQNGLHLEFANGTAALMLTPDFRPVVDKRRRPSRYAPLPMPLTIVIQGFWLCRSELIHPFDSRAEWFKPAAVCSPPSPTTGPMCRPRRSAPLSLLVGSREGAASSPAPGATRTASSTRKIGWSGRSCALATRASIARYDGDLISLSLLR